MAAGNMLLGYARGSVGDVTFQRLKGQQITKARNRKPNNPKTEKQQLQRAKFSGAQLFHKQLVSRFFKFAYEDKTERESDYNAFMRHNTRIAPLIFKQSTRNDEYPVFAPFQVSQGSLPEISLTLTAQENQIVVSVEDWLGIAEMNNNTTIGQLSKNLINSNPNRWQSGDIITILTYGALENAFTAPPSPEYAFECQQVIKQFIIDDKNTQLVTELFEEPDLNSFKPVREDDPIPFLTNDALAIAVIHSRNVSGGLQVSTQSLVLSDKAQEVYESSNYYTASATFIQEILTSWEAADIAILQGALARQSQGKAFKVNELREDNTGTVITKENGIYQVAATVLNAQGAYLYISFDAPKYVPVSDIAITPNITNLTWNVATPIQESQFDGTEVINTNNVNIQYTAGTTYTIRIGNVGSILLKVI